MALSHLLAGALSPNFILGGHLNLRLSHSELRRSLGAGATPTHPFRWHTPTRCSSLQQHSRVARRDATSDLATAGVLNLSHLQLRLREKRSSGLACWVAESRAGARIASATQPFRLLRLTRPSRVAIRVTNGNYMVYEDEVTWL